MIEMLIVDDHALLRETLAEALTREPDIVVVGLAGTGDEAVSLAERHTPDVILLDVEMPGMPAATAVAKIGQVAPDSRIIVLTGHDDPGLLQQFLRLSVAGYLHKAVSRPHLIAVIRAIANSTSTSDQAIAVSLPMRSVTAGIQEPGSALTARETAIIGLVGQALSNRQIGRRLGIEESTVKRHLRKIFTKLSATSRGQAVNKAVAARVIPPPVGQQGFDGGLPPGS